MTEKRNIEKEPIRVEDVIRGLETTLEELYPVLMEQIDDMSTKQLRRAFKSTLTFIAQAKDETEVGGLGQKEQMYLGGLITLVEVSRQYYLHIIKQIQQENAAKAKGESNGEE